MSRIRRLVACVATTLLAAPGAPHAADADWPTGSVTFITSGPPGSAPDVMARVFGEHLEAEWGHPVVVENVPGAEGSLAVKALMAAEPGEALLLAPSGPVMVAPVLRDDLPYDPDADLVPIAALVSDHLAIAVTPSLDATTLDEFVALAQADPGMLNWYAAPGAPDLVFRELMRSTGTEMTHVPYKGVGAPVMTDLASGVLHVALTPMAPVAGLAADGKVRLLAVTNDERSARFPDVPTVAEAGYPHLAIEGVLGAFGWRDMPDDLREQLAADFRAAGEDAAVRERLEASGQTVRVTGPENYARYLAEERERWAGTAATLGLRPVTN